MKSLRLLASLSVLALCAAAPVPAASAPVVKGKAKPGKPAAKPAAAANLDARLIRAVLAEDLAKVKQLLAAGARANAREPDLGYPALALAASRANTPIMKLLLDKGADVDGRSARKETPLMSAAVLAEPEQVKLLLDHGADPNAKWESGETALYSAIGASAEIVKLLLDRGAQPNHVDDLGRTPLMKAAMAADLESAQHLLAKGARVDVKDKEGKTALTFAQDTRRAPVDAEQGERATQIIRLLQEKRVK